MHRIVSAQALENYRVRICFSDALEGVVDLSDLVGKGVFAAWNEPTEFAKVFVDTETSTLAWPGGIDLCPDTLYEDLAAQKAA